MNLTDHILSLLAPSPNKNGMKNPGLSLSGDSIMANGIAKRLRDRGIAVLDLAQPGDTAQSAWRRFPYDVRSMGTVIIEQGTNDISGGRDPVPYLRKMVKYAQAEGRRVILTGITFRELVAPYSWMQANIDIIKLARERGCSHAGWNTVDYSSDDGLHPDDAMNDRLVEQLMRTLAS